MADKVNRKNANITKPRQILTFVIALLAFAGGSLAYKKVIRPFIAVDHCLDQGWRWDTKSAACVFSIEKRPGVKDELLLDYAGLVRGQEEGINRYLVGVRDQYQVESLIVTLPTLQGTGLPEGIQKAANKLFNNWQVGKDSNGRGVLVLLVKDTDAVKVEVGMAVEDIFTDLFTGYAENRQLEGHMQTGTVGHGLVAILEEFERRAEVKHRGVDIAQTIRKMDQKLLSMGAGAVRNTGEFAGKTAPSRSKFARGAQTPEEAWKIIISKFRDEGKYKDVDILTDASKLITGDQNSLNYGWINDYAKNKFEVKVEGPYAVISFGRQKGWDHDPVFLMWTENPPGWKNDMVSTRKYNVRGKAPNWMIERADHPYINLTSYAYWGMGKDIPIDPEDIYTVENESILAAHYKVLKSNNKKDFDTQMQLGRLGTIMALLPQDIHPYLDAAQRLKPDSPLPHKYRAIQAVESNYQYKTAMREIETYLKKGGDPVYGYNFLGYLYYQQGAYQEVRNYLWKVMDMYEKAQLVPPAYTVDKLVRAYVALYADEKRSRAQRKDDMLAAYFLYQIMIENYPGHHRTQWLAPWLKKKGILGNSYLEKLVEQYRNNK